MKINVQRVFLGGTTTKITFERNCNRYLVKNFSNDDIYVSFDEEFTNDTSIRIPSKFFQEVVGGKGKYGEITRVNAIYIKGSGEVEVQQI